MNKRPTQGINPSGLRVLDQAVYSYTPANAAHAVEQAFSPQIAALERECRDTLSGPRH